ncbi:mucin-3A isoform X2 [Amia ocellicauda]|uniref:mucin-3A isoform X2 n=1 Tax=Amia ocellicauda TaxID=2972642 RepID=UPI003463DBBC
MRASEAALLTVLLTVVVFQPPTTADPVLTTPTANGTRLEIQFTLSQTYTLDLNNHTSTVFRALASNITSTINKIYRGSYSSFLLSEVIGFGSGSIQVDLDLVFNSTGSVPSIDEVVSRLRFSSQSFLPIILPSIKGRGVTPGTLAPPITMNATTANIIMTTAVMETRLELQAALMELFSADLSNQSTAALKNTAQYFTVEIENNFKNSKFKESFLRTEVITLSSQLSGSFLVDFDLVFNSSYPVPHINSAITELMVAIYSNQTALPLDPCFFEHRGVTSEAPPTTATPPSTPPAATATGNTSKAPSTMTTAPSSTTTTPTSITATSTATTAAATSSTDAILSTPVPQNTVILIFRIFRDFVSALSDRKSKEFIELSQQLISECDKIFSAQFGSSFISTFVQKFTNGSTITNLQVEFASQTSIPPNNDIIQTFMKAAQNGTFPFAIDLNSIYISNNAAGPSSPFIALLVSIFTALLSSRQFLH